MRLRGQSALEYLTTYGWAVLVGIVVVMALLDIGVFRMSESRPSGFGGFATLRPVDFKCEASGGDLYLSIVNTAGGTIYNLSIGGVPCDPPSLAAGKVTTCIARGTGGCSGVSPGESYSALVTVEYISPVGMQKASAGTVWGVAQ